ncbi:MAG: deoxycytidylate deaminase [Alphaproteobacteria bacterium]
MSDEYVRPSWDEYFLELVENVGKRATCNRGRSGCVITKDKRIIATGYVGSPSGLEHCDEVGHLMKKVIDDDGQVREHCMRTIHAEQNAICQAARHGVSLQGATLYCTMEPCRTCAMMIISVGIEKVVCKRRYHAAQETRDMFAKAGVALEVIVDELQSYEK